MLRWNLSNFIGWLMSRDFYWPIRMPKFNRSETLHWKYFYRIRSWFLFYSSEARVSGKSVCLRSCRYGFESHPMKSEIFDQILQHQLSTSSLLERFFYDCAEPSYCNSYFSFSKLMALRDPNLGHQDESYPLHRLKLNWIFEKICFGASSTLRQQI